MVVYAAYQTRGTTTLVTRSKKSSMRECGNLVIQEH